MAVAARQEQMPLCRGRGKCAPSSSTASDPLTACLDANGTYICTAFNPRCYIIQKVRRVSAIWVCFALISEHLNPQFDHSGSSVTARFLFHALFDVVEDNFCFEEVVFKYAAMFCTRSILDR